MNYSSFKKAFLKRIGLKSDTRKLIFEKVANNSVNVHFIIDNQFFNCEMYTDQFWIDLWADHFKEYVETGEFDFTCAYKIYSDKPEEMNPDDVDKLYQFPLVTTPDNDCYTHSKELSDFMSEYRKTYPRCGFKHVGKYK